MNRLSIFPLLIALGLGGAALAQQDLTPPPPNSTIVMQEAVMQAGEERTFRLETLVTSDIEGGTTPERSQRVFRIEVIKADREGLILAYTQFSHQGSAFPQLATALNGRQIQFQADPSGYPLKVTNWPNQRSAIIDALGKSGGENLIPAVLGLSEDGVIQNILADAVLVAAMQSMPPMAGAKMDEPAQTPSPGVKINGWRLFEGSRASDCTFVLRRVTEIDPASPYAVENKIGERLETVAATSMVDGWVMTLDETARRSRGPQREVVTRKLARQGKTPGSCELQPAAPKGK